MPWKIYKSDDGYCVHKETPDGTQGDVVKCHETEEQAKEHLKALYANTDYRAYLLDNYVSTAPGVPYRLFPFGRIVKNGVVREITPEYARRFKLPHFKPPVKLGSHEDVTPAGGHIVGLEVRTDGLYAQVEMNEQGAKAIEAGDYRYQSPEVIWDDGGIEDPTTGGIISGPLIIGDALLHTPHLGEAAALYEITPYQKEILMAEVKEPEVLKVEVIPEDYEAVKLELAEYKSKVEKFEADKKLAETLTAIKAELKAERFCTQFDAAEVADEAAAMLATMSDAQRAWVEQKLAALAGQVKISNLTEEKGTDAPTEDNPVAQMSAAIKSQMDEFKLNYADAFSKVCKEQPELARKYQKEI